MSKLLEGRKIIFFDFEVFSRSKHPETKQSYWMVVFKDRDTGKTFTIKNNVGKLLWFYNNYKDAIFVGYNSRGYDQWIFKGLLMGMDAGFITEQIIERDIKGHNVVRGAWDFPLLNFDCATGFHSLKQLEAFMGSMIKECSVPFDLDRPLTKEEEKEVEIYCTHDVNECQKVFEKTYNKFTSHMGVMEMFDMDISNVSKTSAQLTAMVLEAKKLEEHDNEFDFIYPDTLKLERYPQIKEWFDSVKDGTVKPIKKNSKMVYEFDVDIQGNITTFALGGLHGALPNFVYEGKIFSLDVQSLYPALILEYGLMSRAAPSDEKFRSIRDERVILKKAGNPLQEALKLVLNIWGRV